MKKLELKYDWVRVVVLSKNYGQHPATEAGILYSSGDGRAFGVTGSPLSDLIVSALIISISQIFLRHSFKKWTLFSIITFILFVQIILTQTRGAWLSLIISFLFLVLLARMASTKYVFINTIMSKRQTEEIHYIYLCINKKLLFLNTTHC